VIVNFVKLTHGLNSVVTNSAFAFFEVHIVFRLSLNTNKYCFCLQEFWLSSANQVLLPESLHLTGVAFSPVINTNQHLELKQKIDIRDVSLNVLVEPHISNADSASCERYSPQAAEVRNSSSDIEVVFDTIDAPIESNITMFNYFDKHCTVADHGQLYQDICHGIGAIHNVTVAQQISEKLCCLLKFFYMECLSDNEQWDSPVFPFHILERYTQLISQDITHQSSCRVSDS